MAGLGLSGLTSGVDTSAIVEQLSAAAAPEPEQSGTPLAAAIPPLNVAV